MKNTIIRFLFAVVLAGLVANLIHSYVGIGVPHYSTFIEIMSYITKPLEALGVAIIYYLLGDRLPLQSAWAKGILLGLIILLVKGQLIRQPFMNVLLQNTFREVFLFQSQVWLANMAMAIIIAVLVRPKYSRKE